MANNIAYMEEHYVEVIQFKCHKMVDMKEKASDMDIDTKRKSAA